MNKVTKTLLLFCLFTAPVNASDLNLSYDFRFRYEYTDDGEKANTRNRNRIRTRITAQYKYNERLDFFARLATAEENTTSANQTLGTDFTLSDIGLDQIYFKYDFKEDMELLVGKMENPFFKPNKSQLIFDGDYNPKGLAINLKHGDVFSNISHITFDSNPSKTINLKGLQFGLSKSINDFTDAKISFAVYDFDEIRGSAPNEVTWNGKHFGNSLDGNGRYLYDFSVRNLSAEVKTKVMAMPVTLFLDVINNSDADENDKGFQYGFNLLINQKWTFKYLYKDIESDATFDALVDSNLGGGGTGHKGHQFNLSYPMTERFSVDVVWFDNKKKMITDYNKIFVDFKYKL